MCAFSHIFRNTMRPAHNLHETFYAADFTHCTCVRKWMVCISNLCLHDWF